MTLPPVPQMIWFYLKLKLFWLGFSMGMVFFTPEHKGPIPQHKPIDKQTLNLLYLHPWECQPPSLHTHSWWKQNHLIMMPVQEMSATVIVSRTTMQEPAPQWNHQMSSFLSPAKCAQSHSHQGCSEGTRNHLSTDILRQKPPKGVCSDSLTDVTKAHRSEKLWLNLQKSVNAPSQDHIHIYNP